MGSNPTLSAIFTVYGPERSTYFSNRLLLAGRMRVASGSSLTGVLGVQFVSGLLDRGFVPEPNLFEIDRAC